MKANMRAMKLIKEDTDAVSPVVATLMLVLVAAGAAVGLNFWMKGFSDDATTNVANPSDCQTLTIAGSSTVYELSVLVKDDFEAHTRETGAPVCVDLDMGGSGAGRQAVGLCVIDIGSSSSSVPASELAKWPDCNGDGKKDFGKELQIFQAATDAVVPVSHSSNSHCTDTLTLTVANMQEIYAKFARDVSGLNAGGAFSESTFIGSNGINKPIPNVLTWDLDTPVTWGDLHNARAAEAAAAAAAIATNTLGDVRAAWNGAAANCVAGVDLITVGEFAGTDDAEACPAACVRTGRPAGTNTDVVIPFDREDPGGTSEVAAQSILGGKQKQLEDLGITLRANLQGDGNQGVWDQVNAHSTPQHALFFSGFGYAVDQGMTRHSFGATLATAQEPSTGNIKDGSFDATRPILYVTAGTPSPVAQMWLDFIMGNPHNNQQYTKAAGFVGTFS